MKFNKFDFVKFLRWLIFFQFCLSHVYNVYSRNKLDVAKIIELTITINYKISLNFSSLGYNKCNSCGYFTNAFFFAQSTGDVEYTDCITAEK